MWEVVAIDLNGDERTKIVTNWGRGMRLARKAMDRGWKVTINQLCMDFYIADEFGDMKRVVSKVSPENASKFVTLWAKADRMRSGCMYWPHGLPMPTEWRVVETEACSVQ